MRDQTGLILSTRERAILYHQLCEFLSWPADEKHVARSHRPALRMIGLDLQVGKKQALSGWLLTTAVRLDGHEDGIDIL